MRVVFAGTPAFSLPCLQALIASNDYEVTGVVSQPDRPAGRGMKLTPSPVKQAALDAGIEVITPEQLGGDETDWLQDKTADFLVVVAFGMLLPKPWLESPKFGAINVHASLLPRWRGAAPIERAMLAGDHETGVCIMHMDEGLDTGPVYAESRIGIEADTTGMTLRAALASLGAELLLPSLAGITDGSLEPRPQDESQASYAGKLTAADRQIDWSQPARLIDRQVRTFAPKPAARTKLHGRWIKVIEGAAVQDDRGGQAGCMRIDAGGLEVCCGEGAYRIRRLQPEGKQAMDAAAFARGIKDKAELKFD